MAKTHVTGELDYLVRTKLPENPNSFEYVLREAFLLEHQCTKGAEIAKVLGITPGRFSQILSSPSTLKPETIQHLLVRLSGRQTRKRLIAAWTAECFGESMGNSLFTGKTVSSKTLRRVDRQIRESRLVTAALTAQEAAVKSTDWDLRQQFLDRAFYARRHLNEPGRAMSIARIIAADAKEQGSKARLATAHFYKAKTLMMNPLCKPESFHRCIGEAVRLLSMYKNEADRLLKCALIEADSVRRLELNATLTFMERGLDPIDKEFLETERASAQGRAKSAKTYQSKFNNLFTAARISVLLGETFQAAELLESAFGSGEFKNLHAQEQCGVIHSMILEQTESPAEVSEHLVKAILLCEKSCDYYHKAMLETRLAEVESARF
ncbi:MAG: hypothetical protein WCK51_01485 [Armatimonadota bacterium]